MKKFSSIIEHWLLWLFLTTGACFICYDFFKDGDLFGFGFASCVSLIASIVLIERLIDRFINWRKSSSAPADEDK